MSMSTRQLHGHGFEFVIAHVHTRVHEKLPTRAWTPFDYGNDA